MSAPIGGHWLVTPVASAPQFTGADFTEEDLLYAKTAEDFVRHEVLTRLTEIEEKREGVMPELLKRAGAQAAGVDAERLADVLEVEDVVPLVAAQPGERLALEVSSPAVRRVRVLQERPDAVLEHREEEPALAAGRLGPPVHGLVAHADVAVEPGRVTRAVAQRGERRSPAARMKSLARRRGRLRDDPLGKSHDRARAACSPTRHGLGYSSAGQPHTIVQSADFGTKSR